MTSAPKPDLSEHEEEDTPFDDVMRKLLEAKPTPRKAPTSPETDATSSD